MSRVNYKLAMVLFMLFCCITVTVSKKIKWTSIVEKISGANDVISMVMAVTEFIDGGDISNEELLKEVQSSIDAAKTEILNEILLTSKFDRIDTAVIAIRSSLSDFKSYINADQNSTEQLKKHFIQRFNFNGVIQHIRFLPDLLTYSIPGTSGQTLIELFEKNANCDHTMIQDFKAFYMNLLSDGISLEVVFMMFQDLEPEDALTTFSNQFVAINDLFREIEGACWRTPVQSGKAEGAQVQMSAGGFIGCLLGVVVVTAPLSVFVVQKIRKK